MQMPLRRKTALASLAFVLAPVMSSCGFDYATDRDYTPGVGTNNRDGQVDVLGASLVTAEGEEGTAVLVAGLANNSLEESATLDDVSGEGLEVEGLEGIELDPQGFANLNDETHPPVVLTGDFEAGDFVSLGLQFSNGERVELDVPVVLNCGYYAETDGLPAGSEECHEETAESGH